MLCMPSFLNAKDIPTSMSSTLIIRAQSVSKMSVYLSKKLKQLRKTVRDISVFLNSGLDMSASISYMGQAAYFQLHNLAKIRYCLTVIAWQTIVHALEIQSWITVTQCCLASMSGCLTYSKWRRTLQRRRVTAWSSTHHTGPDRTTLATDSMAHNLQSYWCWHF